MTFVVCEPCVGCKYTDCVEVCPVDAFYDAGDMLVIDPETCIYCGACVPECPAEAIFPEGEVPTPWVQYVQLNAVKARELVGRVEPVTEKRTR